MRNFFFAKRIHHFDINPDASFIYIISVGIPFTLSVIADTPFIYIISVGIPFTLSVIADVGALFATLLRKIFLIK